MDVVEVLIHVHPELPDAERASVIQEIQGDEGVVAVHFSEVTNHILMVKYDANATDAHKILAHAQTHDSAATIASM